MYPRYEQYQDSGVAWLGEVPSHWGIKRLKFLITELRVGPFGSAIKISDYAESENLLYNQRTVLDNNFFENVISITDEKYVELCSFQVYAGDFLITTRGTIGKVAIVPKNANKGIIHPCLIRFRIDESRIFPRLLKIIFNETAFFQDQLKLKSNATTIDVIYSNSLKELILLLPPLPEQTAIAAFLDCKLAQIDALISKQETLLAKLAEKRTALITHAVTRGLNPAAPLKPSGVAWLGEVPEHWEVKKGNQIFVIHNGATPKTSESDYWGDEIVWITPKDLGDCKAKEIGESAKMITQAGYENCGVSLAPPNSLALSKRAPIGHLAKTTVSAVVNQGCFLLEIQDNSSNVDYFYYLLTGYKDVLNSFGQGSTFMELPREKFAMLKMPFPPLPEQTAIADYLDAQTAQIDALSNKIRQTIARLQEYRRTLITQAVTGKIKVIGENR